MAPEIPNVTAVKRTTFLLMTVPGLLPVTGCQSTVQIGGAYFPAWLLSIIFGVLITAIVHLLLFKKGIDPFVRPRALAYPAMAVAFTLIIYLLFFR